jgi:hypothetical protein
VGKETLPAFIFGIRIHATAIADLPDVDLIAMALPVTTIFANSLGAWPACCRSHRQPSARYP